MRECIIINTGPLIAFARMDALELPGRLPFSFICPCEVREELDEGIITALHPFVQRIAPSVFLDTE